MTQGGKEVSRQSPPCLELSIYYRQLWTVWISCALVNTSKKYIRQKMSYFSQKGLLLDKGGQQGSRFDKVKISGILWEVKKSNNNEAILPLLSGKIGNSNIVST